jgi:pimeloyl-[acyl-carrier protein] methyl ester esterase
MDASGIKLVLLPGMYGTVELFADFQEALPSAFEAQAFGYPNDISLSYAKLLELLPSWVRHWVSDSEPYVIVAESFSTPLAIQFAATNPANLKGLVLSAGFATTPVRGVLRFATPFLAPLLSYLPVNEFGGRIVLSGSTAPQALRARLRAAIASVKPRVLMNRVRAVVACNALEELRAIRVPILYMQARGDRMVNAVCLKEIRRVKPELEVVVLDGTHMLLQQMPHETAEIVADFVRRLG